MAALQRLRPKVIAGRLSPRLTATDDECMRRVSTTMKPISLIFFREGGWEELKRQRSHQPLCSSHLAPGAPLSFQVTKS